MRIAAIPFNKLPNYGFSEDKPLSSAPDYLKPYLDSVDGVVIVGGKFAKGCKRLAAYCHLYRGDSFIGSIRVDVT